MEPTERRFESSAITPIRLTDQISKKIKERVLRGMLRPGQRLVEKDLAREFGVAQNPVREALIELAQLGYVRRVPNKGTYVLELNPHDAARITRVRTTLELLVLDIIFERMETEELDLTLLHGTTRAMETATAAGDSVEAAHQDLLFHRCLWRLASNDFLFEALERVAVPLFAYAIVVQHDMTELERETRRRESLQRHQDILGALVNRDPETARARLLEHRAVWFKLEQTLHATTPGSTFS